MNRPRVSILTPVYNGGPYLAQCIESVLAQDYGDFEYTVVNNCSTDDSLDIAEAYALRDRRVRVRTNSAFVSAIDNHNLAFRLVPDDAKYCKVVSADDWIMPDCVSKMIGLAEAHPTVGVVGCYQRSGDVLKWRGVPITTQVLPGRDAARLGLLHGIHVLGTPTSVLYRADLVRMRQSFFPHAYSHADTSACYESFQYGDFGFLHEVLAVERVHSGQWSTEMDAIDAGSVGYLDVLLQYGPRYLSEAEFATRKAAVFDAYYRALGGYLLKAKGRKFWSFHRARLKAMGCDLEWYRVAKASVQEVASEARSPITAIRKAAAVLKGE